MIPVEDKIVIRVNLWSNDFISKVSFYLVHNGLRIEIYRRTGGDNLRRVVKDQLYEN